MQRSAGNHAVQRFLANAQPTWGSVDGTTGQGTHVEAIVGPGVKMGTGPASPANFRPYEYTRLFSSASKAAQYCQGHLLNENLSGPGRPADPLYGGYAAQNLTAFPQWPTNTDHKTVVEKLIKDGVGQKKWLKYEVSIGYSTDSGPRLRKRLSLAGAAFDTAWKAGTGLSHTDASFGYASSLSASWVELDNTKASTNSAPVVKSGGLSGTANFSIPSPLTYVADSKQNLEYPNWVKVKYVHMKTFKDPQTWNATVAAVASSGRHFIMSERWKGVDDARNDKAAAGGAGATYLLGYNHYGEGVAAARTGKMNARFGRGYTSGLQDFTDGIQHGRLNPLSAPPVYRGDKAGHAEFWAGVALGATRILTNPPAGNKAHIAGHAEYWAGVKHARANAETAPPANLAEKEGHTDYWAGVKHAKTKPLTVPPVGKLAAVEGHKDYWAGVTHAKANAQASPPTEPGQAEGHKDYWDGAVVARGDATSARPAPLAQAQGHVDFLSGLTHSRTNARGTAPPPGSLVTTSAFTEYWQGVDHARANPPTVACPVPGSAAAAGVADYRTGVQHATAKVQGTALAVPSAAAAEGAGDYWAGETHALANGVAPPVATAATGAAFAAFWSGAVHARASLANLQGVPPADRVAARGFTAYGDGAAAQRAGQGNNAANPAFSGGWTDSLNGELAARANAVDPTRTESGYLWAVQVTRVPVPKRSGDGEQSETKKRKVDQ